MTETDKTFTITTLNISNPPPLKSSFQINPVVQQVLSITTVNETIQLCTSFLQVLQKQVILISIFQNMQQILELTNSQNLFFRTTLILKLTYEQEYQKRLQHQLATSRLNLPRMYTHLGVLLPPYQMTFHNYNHRESILSDSSLKVSQREFIRDFKSVKWSVAIQNHQNIGFKNYMLTIKNLLKNYALFKEQTKRKQKLRFKSWITKSILTCIKQRQKIFHEMIKAKSS